ncbi:MAG: DoxX family membrane protein [Phycisphaerales bacterium]
MRTALACNFSPLLLRVALGVTFLWAGAAKVFYVDDYTGARAAALANAGVQSAIDAAQPLPTITPPPAPTPEPRPTPPTRPSGGSTNPSPDAADPDNPSAEPEEPSARATPAAGPSLVHTTPSHTARILPARFTTMQPESSTDSEPTTTASSPTGTTPPPASTAPAIVYEPEQFPEDRPVQLRRLHGLVLAMDAAHARGQWPDFLAGPAAYTALAWAAALVELLGGIFLLFGFLTRIAAISVAGVMAGAIWMTQIGPALSATDPSATFLGFLPALRLDDPAAWTSAWKDLLWQFMLLMAALAVFFSGPGKLAIDALLFVAPGEPKRSRRRDDDDEI